MKRLFILSALLLSGCHMEDGNYDETTYYGYETQPQVQVTPANGYGYRHHHYGRRGYDYPPQVTVQSAAPQSTVEIQAAHPQPQVTVQSAAPQSTVEIQAAHPAPQVSVTPAGPMNRAVVTVDSADGGDSTVYGHD